MSQSYSVRTSLTKPVMPRGSGLSSALASPTRTRRQSCWERLSLFRLALLTARPNSRWRRRAWTSSRNRRARCSRCARPCPTGSTASTRVRPRHAQRKFHYAGCADAVRAATTESGQQFLARAEVAGRRRSLFALEQFSFGGIDSVRGYRKNQVLTDNGVVASIEYRAPLRDLVGRGEPRRSHTGTAQYLSMPATAGTPICPTRKCNLSPAPASASIGGPKIASTPKSTPPPSWRTCPSQQDELVQDFGVGFRLTARLW